VSDARDTESDATATRDEGQVVRPENVRAVRLGHGANCSSVGSVIDTLFASAVVGGAIFAAIAAALRNEDVTVVGPQGKREPAAEGEPAPLPEDEAP
jgi:hypothetical protein